MVRSTQNNRTGDGSVAGHFLRRRSFTFSSARPRPTAGMMGRDCAAGPARAAAGPSHDRLTGCIRATPPRSSARSPHLLGRRDLQTGGARTAQRTRQVDLVLATRPSTAEPDTWTGSALSRTRQSLDQLNIVAVPSRPKAWYCNRARVGTSGLWDGCRIALVGEKPSCRVLDKTTRSCRPTRSRL